MLFSDVLGDSLEDYPEVLTPKQWADLWMKTGRVTEYASRALTEIQDWDTQQSWIIVLRNEV